MKNPYFGTKAKDPDLKGKVVVAMSGGVDSSVAAVMLKEQGFDVVGIALQTTDYSKYIQNDSGGTCCSVKDMEDARRVAEKIDIPFYVLSTEKAFDRLVVDYFVADYLQGRTPNPCAMCNTKVKFNHLYRKAMDLGADFIATGHYAKVSKEPGLGVCLWRSEDTQKDQTYFLFNLTQRQLEKTLFPIGHLPKAEVRKIAERFGLPVAEKPDSQELCFVPGNDYAGFIESRVSASLRKPGYIVTADQVVLGNHEGLYKYTIGQRKGLGTALDTAKALQLADADDFYVTKLDPMKNQVVLGPSRDLGAWGLLADSVNWILEPDLRKTRRVQARIRHRAELVDCEIDQLADSRVEVRFFEPQRAVTPGQAVVFYDGRLCLGGGWIESARAVAVADRPVKVEESVAMLT